MSNAENPYAGQGPVLLDIGDDIGALVVTMPAELDGIEVEIRPKGDGSSAVHRHDHEHTGEEHHTHDHQGHSHADEGLRLPHVAVVARPTAGNQIHSLVFPELVEGVYELYQRPHGPVELTTTITGGHVTQAAWPGTPTEPQGAGGF